MKMFAVGFQPRFAAKALGQKQASITTPSKFQIDVFSPGETGKKARLIIDPTHAQFQPLLKSQYVYVIPQLEMQQGQVRLYWTQQYIGTDQRFYDAGYRWGISLGGDLEAFKATPYYRKGGGLNLENGKYMIAIRQDQRGRREVVLGKEDRQIAADFTEKGKMPETDFRKESLRVTNHSMLISRGRPYDSNEPDAFSAIFAGEVEVYQGQITAINDQTGQLFGPKGLIQPPDTAKPEDKVMRQPDFEANKMASLNQAKAILSDMVGSKNIRLIKVIFTPDSPPEAELKAHQILKLPQAQAETLKRVLREKPVQVLFDMFQADPEKRLQLLKALAKNADHRHAVFSVLDNLKQHGTLKPEQSAVLGLNLLICPEAMGFFEPASPLYLPGLSDNTKRKILEVFNAEGSDQQTFAGFVNALRQQPHLMQFAVGRRIPKGFVKLVMADLADADRGVEKVHNVFKAAQMHLQEAVPLTEEPEIIRNVGAAPQRLADIAKQIKKKGAKSVTVLVEANPFNGVGLYPVNLRKNIKILQKLMEKGVKVYRQSTALETQALEYLVNLFSYAHPAADSREVPFRREMKALLEQYSVDVKAMHQFVREKFTNRWSNDQIISAFANESKPFRKFLDDLCWFIRLPKASYKAAGV